jgi:lipoate-protein ligase A
MKNIIFKFPQRHFTCSFMKSNIIVSNSRSIEFHLAVEEYLYNFRNINEPIIFLYQNDKTIVIGRHQNPWKECNVTLMDKDGVTLARKF